MLGLTIVLAIITGLWALRRMSGMKLKEVRKFQRQLLGGGLLFAALFLLFHGNLFLGLSALALSSGLLGGPWFLPQKFQSRTKAEQPQQNSAMSKAEALHVLGLQPGASVEAIKAAHKRLQRANHPDAGGTDYLAGKINQARDTLLNT